MKNTKEREELPLCSKNDELRFLGSGFPLFYNFILYCIGILLVLLISSGAFNLFSNYLGDFCEAEEYSTEGCASNWMSHLSLVNKSNDSIAMEFQQNLNILSCFLIILLLLWFRRSQRKINAEIDEKQNSPADYTIIVRNIPNNRNSDYVESLTNFFTNDIDPVKKFRVTKVNLLWELDEIEEFEKKIRELIDRKKKLLPTHRYEKEHHEIKKLDEEIEKTENLLEKKLKEIENSPDYFAGMAFISFQTEDGRRIFLKN